MNLDFHIRKVTDSYENDQGHTASTNAACSLQIYKSVFLCKYQLATLQFTYLCNNQLLKMLQVKDLACNNIVTL